ncbi:hypothetical protein CRUP_005936 [Coryphaenoides rupestris]|nr:hypothetical protein CRUP_005936 [Coryphaenoides rupestris]
MQNVHGCMQTQSVPMLHSNSDKGDGAVRYILSGEGAGTIFIIDEVTGDIHAAKSLDRERKSNYVLHAQALDRYTEEALEPKSEFIIKVQDINDNAPKFPEGPFVASVPEINPSSASSVSTAAAAAAAVVVSTVSPNILCLPAAGERDTDRTAPPARRARHLRHGRYERSFRKFGRVVVDVLHFDDEFRLRFERLLCVAVQGLGVQHALGGVDVPRDFVDDEYSPGALAAQDIGTKYTVDTMNESQAHSSGSHDEEQ